MGFFDNCRPKDRFTSSGRVYRDDSTICIAHDWDQRRTVAVGTTWGELSDENDYFFFWALSKHIDGSLSPETIAIQVSAEGDLVWASTKPEDDFTRIPFYPSVSDYPAGLPTVRRSKLTEIERVGIQADLVSYKVERCETKRVVFKYYVTPRNTDKLWHEAHCVMSIPRYPNIVPFDSLVVDSLDGIDARVLGFTTKFIPGGTLFDNVQRIFKLKYLEQLIEAIDFLNLKLGIIHGDISPWNLLIDEEADNLLVFDFNLAARLGWEGDQNHGKVFSYDKHRNDVKYTIFTLYEIITRDFHFRDEETYPEDQDAADVLRVESWKQHPDVRLDASPEKYRAVLDEWVARREKTDAELTHYTLAPEHISWPDVPEYLEARLRQTLVRNDEKFFEWQRPGSRAIKTEREEKGVWSPDINGSVEDTPRRLTTINIQS
ncbi:hypothetical protein B0H63DRAFT_166849 [Podospora didyma]|uniref:EKC/KEOPS complex subunit BUD32 n=1 Tax=Podospora didyma TaxID=330526 RepID=A0AAE0U1Z0_9PEZI|nr:hypothetical protein B0H63DRAFT_166849 [Podospora didyma]